MKLTEKRILVSGGASGLGQAAAKYFASNYQARIVILDLDEEAGTKTVSSIGSGQAIFCRADVTELAEVRSAVRKATEVFGGIDICINCAGIGTPSKILDGDGLARSPEHFAKVVSINLVGSYNVMALCVETMLRNDPEDGEERGVVINTSSGAAFEAQIGQAAYAASKAGLIGLNLPAARELGGNGIRVNAIAPGPFRTPMVEQLSEDVIAHIADEAQGPKRLGHMDEFAHCCAFLIENSYMNADCVRLDAGVRLQAR